MGNGKNSETGENNKNSNGKRKWFPGIRIVEGIIIAIGAGVIFGLAGNFILIPKLELKLEMEVKSICTSLNEIKNGMAKMQEEIVFLKIQDKQYEGDIELLRYHTGLKSKSKKVEE